MKSRRVLLLALPILAILAVSCSRAGGDTLTPISGTWHANLRYEGILTRPFGHTVILTDSPTFIDFVIGGDAIYCSFYEQKHMDYETDYLLTGRHLTFTQTVHHGDMGQDPFMMVSWANGGSGSWGFISGSMTLEIDFDDRMTQGTVVGGESHFKYKTSSGLYTDDCYNFRGTFLRQ
jgi:hypothetical protein